MSHYKIGVIVDNPEDYEVDDILAPYSENLAVEPYIGNTKEQLIEYAKCVNTHLEEWNLLSDEERYKKYIETYEITVDEDGNEITTYNPNSKYDYYTIYDDEPLSVLKSKVKTISSKEIKKYKKIWDWFNSDEEDTDDDDIMDYTFWRKSYYLDRYKDFETFLRVEHYFDSGMPYAIVDKNSWYAFGEVGWFGCDDTDRDTINKYIDFVYDYLEKKENNNKYIVWVDCHI